MQIVPQYIDVEDRVAGPLTWKHIGWLFLCGGILAIMWTFLDRVTFYIAAAFIVPLFAALAFWKPNNVTLIEFIGYGLGYMFRPRLYTWQREVEKKKTQKKQMATQVTMKGEERKLTTDEITAIAQTLDSRGAKRNEQIQQLIREQLRNNK
jgi:hypothetical protein